MDKKRIFFIILFIILTIGIGYAIYRVFFAKPPAAVPPPAAPITGGRFPAAGVGAPTAPGVVPPGALPAPTLRPEQVTTFQPAPPIIAKIETQAIPTVIIDPVATKTGAVQYYNQEDGKFYRLGADGRPVALSDQVFYNVKNVAWSPNRAESIIEYPDGSNIYYNFSTKKQVTLPQHWESFSFSPLGDRLAAKSIGLDPGNRWLIESDPDGTNVRPLEALGENGDKVIVKWSPNKQVVALSRTGEPQGGDRQEVLLIGEHHENFPSLIVEGLDLRAEWSPEGKRLLYSVYSAANNYNPQLWITDASGANIGAHRQPLALNTWADKCAFSDERFVYCGVPTRLDDGTGFVPALADSTPDDLYRIDLQTGIKTAIPLTNSHVIKHMFVGNNGQTLFFTDKTQSGLFQVGLQ